MIQKNRQKAKIILVVYLAATLALLLLGYSVQSPKVALQEFPFTITYTLQGQTETISDVYVVEYIRTEKYIGDDAVAWFGYIKDHNRLEPDWYSIADLDGKAFSVNLNIEPGYLMGDPNCAGMEAVPSLSCYSFDGTNDIIVTDPAELEQLGFTLVSWEYPEPIENRFSFGGISLSSEGTMLTAAIAVIALLACVILIKRDREITGGVLNKVSVVLNFLIMLVAFPFILICSALTEIVADASLMQQFVYLSPALTAAGVAASVALRRCGFRKASFFVQFIGFIAFAAVILV